MRNIIIGTATIAVAVEFAATAAQTAGTGGHQCQGRTATHVGASGDDYINGGTGGTGPGDHCSDKSGGVIGADFYECETYDTYLFAGTYGDMPGLRMKS